MIYYSKCLKYIENCDDPAILYSGLRAILKEANEKETFLKSYYPEDYQIKKLQRAADAKYISLGGR